MVGVLRETDYHTIKEQHDSDQQQLSAYSSDSPTTIAVVSRPRDTGIETMCDEWWPELGMPERHLDRFWSYRAGFKTNSAVEDATARAYKEARLDHYYDQYIRKSDEAQNALSELVRRLTDGEDITLVCFEDGAQPCHRYRILEIVEARLSSEYELGAKELLA